MREQFIALVQDPTGENYGRAWEAVTSAEAYDPYSSDFEQIENLLEAERPVEARALIHSVMGKWLLSPRIHMLASIAAKAAGDADGAGMEGFLYLRCVEGILSTGDGSRGRPYLVTCTSDEYDVLTHLRKTITRQALVEDGLRRLDVISCDDGTELHFDITRPYGRLMSRMGG
jgi:hypothetical protein